MYASMIEGMDKSLGDVIDYLEENDLADNTVLLFMSDNGGLSMVPPMGGEQHTQNLPLRAGKGSVYEGGIREPMLVKWPGVTRPGSVTDHYLIIEDFFPTLRSEEHTSELQSLMRSSYAVFCLKKKNTHTNATQTSYHHIQQKHKT